jgi:hypothetical protein
MSTAVVPQDLIHIICGYLRPRLFRVIFTDPWNRPFVRLQDDRDEQPYRYFMTIDENDVWCKLYNDRDLFKYILDRYKQGQEAEDVHGKKYRSAYGLYHDRTVRKVGRDKNVDFDNCTHTMNMYDFKVFLHTLRVDVTIKEIPCE